MRAISPNPTSKKNTYLILIGFIVFTVLYRIFASNFASLSNTSPTMALCFGGGLLLGKRLWWFPALLIFSSDIIIGMIRGHENGFGMYSYLNAGLFCLSAWMGAKSVRWNGCTWPTMWCGVLVSSLVFYVVGNTFTWATYPGYTKDFAGWWQSQTTGIPGPFPPAWHFLRSAIIADSFWCIIAGFLFFFRFSPGSEAAEEWAAH